MSIFIRRNVHTPYTFRQSFISVTNPTLASQVQPFVGLIWLVPWAGRVRWRRRVVSPRTARRRRPSPRVGAPPCLVVQLAHFPTVGPGRASRQALFYLRVPRALLQTTKQNNKLPFVVFVSPARPPPPFFPYSNSKQQPLFTKKKRPSSSVL
jgi:hypothetical protein